MIVRHGREIASASYGMRPLTVIYYGSRVVWQAVRSCFGRGYWVNDKPWSNTEGWTI